ncbi:FecR family protein [Chitinophaga sp. 30R24]|uniref:FecR family protein n=1 Tax=Chitinophaga sp. 30R24 TaxID=3248838 RepID=UPI003B9075CD
MNQPENKQEALLQKYLNGECDPEEIAILYSWLFSSDKHKHLLSVMKDDFERVLQQQPVLPEEISNRIEMRLLQSIDSRKVNLVPRSRWWGWAAAAAVALLLTTAGAYYYYRIPDKVAASAVAASTITDIMPGTNKAVLTLADGSVVTLDSAGNQVIQQGGTRVQQANGKLQYAMADGKAPVGFNTLKVPCGGQFTIVLSDGTQVWLNSASSLRYPTSFTGKERVVEMQGQGYFAVKQNAHQPFVVKVNNTEVQVLGTDFDIMAYLDEEEMRTTLVSGAVKVKQGSTEKYLKPGQQAAIDNNTGVMEVRKADISSVTAWKTGFFEFDNTNIYTIMRQLARWYDIEIDTKNGDNKLYGGRINRNLPLSEMLSLLESSGAKFILEGKKLTVIR